MCVSKERKNKLPIDDDDDADDEHAGDADHDDDGKTAAAAVGKLVEQEEGKPGASNYLVAQA